MDTQLYLDRINFHKKIVVTKEVLFELQKTHLLNVPFENLDIHYGKKISIQPNDIYQKVIIEKRGGFCYELNGLFHQLLKKIGFNVKLISAQVHIKKGEYSPKYDHLAIIATIDNQKYLVDVGFGKFSLEPLKIEINQKIKDNFGQFKFDKYDSDFFRINEIVNNDLIPQYIFKIQESKLSEFEKRCDFHQTSKDSHFTQKKVISIAKENGRITLNNTRLKITHLGIEKEIRFDEKEYKSRLKEHFNIEIKKAVANKM